MMKNWKKIGCLFLLCLIASGMFFWDQRKPDGGMAMLCGGMLLILLIMPIVSLVWAFRDWKRVGVFAFFPLAISILAIFLAFKASDFGLKRRISEFRTRLPEYEDFVTSLADGSLERKHGIKVGNWKQNVVRQGGLWVDLRGTSYNHLGYAAVATRESNNVLTVRFLVCVWLNGHHRKYVYRSDGEFDKVLTQREGPGIVIDQHWRAVSD